MGYNPLIGNAFRNLQTLKEKVYFNADSYLKHGVALKME